MHPPLSLLNMLVLLHPPLTLTHRHRRGTSLAWACIASYPSSFYLLRFSYCLLCSSSSFPPFPSLLSIFDRSFFFGWLACRRTI
ncbi:hypothetical protein FA13DRAFT_1322396 [Coprinellus micaceus]|uniref:Secreted peptide n=1 Tax=Coprinellus micaceus TaxID=71717 RepID=A0A4Y7R5T0_COPMI|nr:hypothetical protein FA13DRAFT_1322396 [Coprinellus micaceus]